MPLIKSASAKAIGPNIKAEMAAKKPYKQALAIALSTQDRAKGLAAGGLSGHSMAATMPHDAFHPSGLFHSDTAGRTDRLPRTVPADSFVMPSDVISSLGQGNTLAGSKIMDGLMHSGPYGTKITKPPSLKRADGGAAGGVSHVMVAGGEYLCSREDLEKIGAKLRKAGKSKARTDLAAGHEWARQFVDKVRGHAKAFLRNAPKPKA